MPRKHFKSITINEKIVDKMDLSFKKVDYLLQKSLDEKQSLIKLASKITKVPASVHVYTNFTMMEDKNSKNV